MAASSAHQKRRLRGVMLKLVYENHEAQQYRLDDVTLTGVLERLQFDVYVNLVREILQDLNERGFISYESEKNRTTGAHPIRKIKITPKGRDLIEKTTTDPAVEVE
jgi:DNA-binding PadR family transcriptional regulator